MKKKPAKKSKPKTIKKSKAKKIVKTKTKIKAKTKKSSSKRPKAKVAAVTPKPAVMAPPNSVLLGYVEDYFAKIGVIALTLKSPLRIGQKIHVLGHTTSLELAVDSMQIDHTPVTQAGPQDGVGIKVLGRSRRGDHVYLLK